MARLSRHLWGGTSLKTAAKEATDNHAPLQSKRVYNKHSTDRVSQAGRSFVHGLSAVTFCNLNVVCRSRSVRMDSILACSSVCVPLERRQRKVTCKRLGWNTVCCVSAIDTDTPLPFFSGLRMVFICLVCTPHRLENCVFDITKVKRQWN